MLNVSEGDKEFLKQHIKNVDELINGSSVNALLIALDEEIMYKGFDKEWFYNDFGKKAQDVRDRILYEN